MGHCGKQKNRGILFLLPSLIGVNVFFVIPYVAVIIRSLGGSGVQDGYGMKHYKEIICNKAFQIAIRNTAIFMGISIPLLLLTSLIIAYGIFILVKKDQWIKTGLLVPMLLPVSTVVILWQFCFHKYGVLNKILGFLSGEGIDWINSEYSIGVFILFFLWRNIGYVIVLWLAGIYAIPDEIMQAGKIDGANTIQSFCYIVCPQLTYCFLCNFVLAIINSFKIYREIYLMAGEYPNQNIYMMQQFFHDLFRDLRIGELSAGAVIVLVTLAIVLLGTERICTKKGFEL